MTPHGVDPAFTPGDGADRRLPALRRRGPGAQGPARRCSRRRRPSACRSSSPAPRRSPPSRASCARAAPTSAATSRRPSSPSSTAAPRRSCSRRATRASACRCSRRWRAALPVVISDDAALVEVAGGRRRVRRRRRLRGRGPARARRPRALRARPGSNARGTSRWERDGAPHRRGLPERTAVRVAAIVVSHGHPRELEQSLPGARAAGRRARRDRERAGLGARRASRRSHNEQPLGFGANVNLGVARTDGRARRLARTRTRCPSRARSRRCGRSWRRTRAAGSPGRAWCSPTARWQPSRRRFPTVAGTIVRRTPLRLRRSGSAITTTSTRRRPTTPVAADWMLGGFLMLRRAMLEELGGFDEGFRLYGEDIDLAVPRDARGLGALVRAGGGRRARAQGRDRHAAG